MKNESESIWKEAVDIKLQAVLRYLIEGTKKFHEILSSDGILGVYQLKSPLNGLNIRNFAAGTFLLRGRNEDR